MMKIDNGHNKVYYLQQEEANLKFVYLIIESEDPDRQSLHMKGQ